MNIKIIGITNYYNNALAQNGESVATPPSNIHI